MPCPVATRMRSSQSSLGPSRAEVQQSTRRSTRSGASLASHMPTIPPIERPQKEKRSIPSRSNSARASRPRSSISYSPAGRAILRARDGRSAAGENARAAPAPDRPTCAAWYPGSSPLRARARPPTFEHVVQLDGGLLCHTVPPYCTGREPGLRRSPPIRDSRPGRARRRSPPRRELRESHRLPEAPRETTSGHRRPAAPQPARGRAPSAVRGAPRRPW